jgi:hypothetical protein
VILFISALGTTLPRVVAVRQVEDKYSGMTPEWSNYCKISEWVSTNLTSDALVACRKPSISFIYGHGRRFYGITRIPSYPADSILVNWKQKNNPFYMIAASSIGKNPVSKELYFDFTNSIAGFGINDDMGMHKLKFYIMAFPDTIRARTLDELKHSNINVTTDIDSLKRILNEPGSKISIIYPDSLLRMLLKAKVTHVITANLTNYKTVERLMSYIEAKYPRIKTKIMQIGADDSVPASIYKLNYDLYGFKLQP